MKGTAIIDGEMFDHIAIFGRPEDREMIVNLPNQVRLEQQDKARICVEKYLANMKPFPKLDTGNDK